MCYGVHMTNRITKARAEKLWNLLRSSLFTAQEAIAEIIEKRAWEPLGYSTLLEAWHKELNDVSLTASPLIRVVYALIDEGATDAEIGDVVKGISLTGSAVLRRQHDNQVPPEHATLYITGNNGRQRGVGSRGTLFIHVGPEVLAQWTRIARDHDSGPAELATEILVREFAALDK